MPPRLTPHLITQLATRLTDRDRELLSALHTHRLLTTHHAAALFWHNRHSRRARTRLLHLHRLTLIDRFRPTTATGTAPWHWILAPAGARILALHRNTTPDELGYRPDHALALAHSTRLAHTTGVLDCMVAFTLAARTTPGATLATWWPEARCAAEWGRYVRPDAYLRWQHNDTTIDAFLEYDTGTEPLARVAAKLPGYAALADVTRITSPLLLAAPTPTRETHLAAHLAAAATAVPVWLAPHSLLAHPGPAAPIWRPAHPGPRRRLADLAP